MKTGLNPKHILIEGAVGQLEVVVDQPRKHLIEGVSVVVCHPHPLFQGTMYNKVVTTVSRAFRELGVEAVRFNFRGVGYSEGDYGEGVGEVEDLLAVVRWLRQEKPNQKIILAGFSFGGSVAFKGASQIEGVESLLTVAPAVTRFPMDKHPEPTMPWYVIHADDDEVVEPKAVFEWLTTEVKCQYTLTKMTGCGHFFHGKLPELRQAIEYYFQPRLNGAV